MVVVVLAKVIDYITRGKIGRYDNGEMKKTLAKIREDTHDLMDLHAPRDQDGIPLWYIPRSWGTTQKEILAELRKLNGTMNTRPCALRKMED